MSDKTLTRMDLSEAVFKEWAYPEMRALSWLKACQPYLRRTTKPNRSKSHRLERSACVIKARVGRNPKTGEEVPITPRRVLTFRPSHLMKEKVALGNKC